uniref:Uncharacterized protein n=1 Tax=Timema poppense TaxID=170557 RepID=A0A7R9DVA0_TIMPO|nr:unnamed protein product [Timema poppensis]
MLAPAASVLLILLLAVAGEVVVKPDQSKVQVLDKINTRVRRPQVRENIDTRVRRPQVLNKVDTRVRSPQARENIDTRVRSPQAIDKVDTRVRSSQAIDKVDTRVRRPQVLDKVDTRVRRPQYKRKPRITSFTYENCGDLNDPGRLQTIQLRHVEDGDILVTAVATTSVKLEPPISVSRQVTSVALWGVAGMCATLTDTLCSQTDIELFKRFMGMWIKLPCINKMVGSCKHQDLCAFGLDECPFKPLRDNNIPCQCPIAEVRTVNIGE